MITKERMEIEQAVLGRLLTYPSEAARALTLRAEFFTGINRDIFEAIYSLVGETGECDIVAVASRCKASMYEVSCLVTAEQISSPSVEFSLREHWLADQLQRGWIEAQAAPNGRNMMEMIKADIERMEAAVTSKSYASNPYEQSRESVSKRKRLHPTGVEPIDVATGGFEPGEYVLIAAHPSRGKSALACTIAWNMRAKGVIYHSYEMRAEHIIRRILARLTMRSAPGLSVNQIKRGEYHESWSEYLVRLTHEMEQELPGIQDAAGKDCAILCDEIRRSKELVHVIDHIGRVPHGRIQEATPRITAVSNKLAQTFKATGKIGIVISPLNRGSARTNACPTLADLRDTGALESDGDTIFFVHDPNHEANKAAKQSLISLELAFEKTRDGMLGPQLCWFDKNHSYFYGETPTGDAPF